MSTTLTSVSLRRAGSVPAPPSAPEDGAVVSDARIATASARLLGLGFAFSPDLVHALRRADDDAFLAWWDAVLEAAREATDTTVEATPFYPDFPAEVMSASDATLYLNAILHYFGDVVGERIVPRRVGTLRADLLDFPRAKAIGVVEPAHLDEVLTAVLTSPLGWGPTELADVAVVVEGRRDLVLDVVRTGMGSRENRAHLWALAQRTPDRELADAVESLFDSATDALRAAVAWAGFSPALLPITRVEVELKPGRWERSGLRPSWVPPVLGHEDRDRVRFGAIPTRLRRSLLAVVDADPHASAELARRPGLWKTLGERLHPGDYAERYPQAYAAFTALRHGTARGRNSAIERGMAAGDVPAVLDAVRDRPGELVRMRIPGALRTTVTGFDIIGRGSRVALPLVNGHPATMVRLFCHWRDQADRGEDGRVDIDLSGVLYDADLTRLGEVYYANLRESGLTHSGDFTSAPEGAAEYLDVDVATLRARGVRYVAISVISYTGQPFSTIPELFAGVQVRTGEAQRGEVFDPRSVATKFALASGGRATVPLLVDLESLEMVWVDAELRPRERTASLNVLGTTVTERELIQGVLSMTGPSVGDVLRANIAARGAALVVDDARSVTPDHLVLHDVNGLSIPMAQVLADWL